MSATDYFCAVCQDTHNTDIKPSQSCNFCLQISCCKETAKKWPNCVWCTTPFEVTQILDDVRLYFKNKFELCGNIDNPASRINPRFVVASIPTTNSHMILLLGDDPTIKIDTVASIYQDLDHNPVYINCLYRCPKTMSRFVDILNKWVEHYFVLAIQYDKCRPENELWGEFLKNYSIPVSTWPIAVSICFGLCTGMTGLTLICLDIKSENAEYIFMLLSTIGFFVSLCIYFLSVYIVLYTEHDNYLKIKKFLYSDAYADWKVEDKRNWVYRNSIL